MRKEYLLKGLDCPNCAAKIEKEVGELNGVHSSTMNLMKQTLTIDVDAASAASVAKVIESIVHSHEPHVVVSEKGATQTSKIYLLKGLDCPNCAAKIEKEVGELDGVSSSTVNLMKQTLTISVDASAAATVAKQIETIVHSHEPDVAVSEYAAEAVPTAKSKETKEDDDDTRKMTIRLISGAVIYAAGIILGEFFKVSLPIQLAFLIVSYVILGGDVVMKAVKNIAKGRVFDENFLMSLSTVGAFVIGEYPEAVAVMLFYQVGEYFQNTAVKRSRKSIADLMDIRPDAATVSRNGELMVVSPETVAVGEVIVVKPGEKIPLDGIVFDGESMLDTKALTGESVPRTVHQGDEALSGCINQSGVLTIQVTKAFGESTVSKIIDLVENASSRKAPTENFITTFARYYTPVVVILAAILAIAPPLLFGAEWIEWIRRGFVFLVISCPCALVISIPLTFFGGIGAASKHGVLVKGSNYLEALNSVSTVVFDKTGTLTKGVFKVTDILPVNGFTSEQVLEYAAMAESYSNHPIAKSILTAYGQEIDQAAIAEYKEISGHGISVNISGKLVLAGNTKLMDAEKITYKPCDQAGTKVYVSVDGQFAGCILIADEVKADSQSAIAALKRIGVEKTVMLTGDDEKIGKAVAEQLGLDEYYAQLLPDQKVEKLELLDNKKRTGTKLAFIGDGINDAPVLARADVGKILNLIFALMAILLLLCVIGMKENSTYIKDVFHEDLSEGWTLSQPDGTRSEITFPYDYPDGNPDIQISYTLPQVPDHSILKIACNYKSMTAYVDGEEIFHALPSTFGMIKTDMGHYVALIPLSAEHSGKEIVIHITERESGYRSEVRSIHLTSVGQYGFQILEDYALHLVFSIMMILCSVTLLGIWFVLAGKNAVLSGESYKSLLWISLFSASLGVWFFTEAYVWAISTGAFAASGTLSYMALSLLPLSLLGILRSICAKKLVSLRWIVSIAKATLIAEWILFLTGLVDFSDMLILLHTECVIAAGIFAIYMTLKRELFWAGGVFKHGTWAVLGMLVITLVTYARGGNWLLGALGTAFIILASVIFSTFAKLNGAMKEVAQTKQYKEYALTDIMTGLKSRYAYTIFEAQHSVGALPNDLHLMFLDIDILKKTNDTLGHAAGDELIIGASKCIKDAFGDIANCFRMGGDEFLVAITENSDVVQERVELFNQLVSKWSGRYVSGLSVSYGVASAKEHPDLNFEALLKTADDIMYQHKNQQIGRK